MTGLCPNCGRRDCDCAPDEDDDEHDEGPRETPIYPKAQEASAA